MNLNCSVAHTPTSATKATMLSTPTTPSSQPVQTNAPALVMTTAHTDVRAPSCAVSTSEEEAEAAGLLRAKASFYKIVAKYVSCEFGQLSGRHTIFASCAILPSAARMYVYKYSFSRSHPGFLIYGGAKKKQGLLWSLV